MGAVCPPPPPIRVFGFLQGNFSLPPAVFSSCTHISKFGENRLLWLRDMTSKVTGGQAIFE